MEQLSIVRVMQLKNIAILADSSEKAQSSKQDLTERYSFLDPELAPHKASLVIALGGDGFMLHTMHRLMEYDVPIFGMNRGTVGFLLNKYSKLDLEERLKNTKTAILHPLQMKAICVDGSEVTQLAINEVSLLREKAQAAHIRVSVDGHVQLEQMVCDGVMVSTPAGSTAYNLSAHGPVIPLNSDILALTPISVFRPRRWRGALLPSDKVISFEVLNPQKRPVSAVADFHEIRDVREVRVMEDKTRQIKLLFDETSTLQDRIIKEQFVL